MDSHLIGNVDDSTDYLVREILENHSQELSVQVSGDANPELAKDYDVVLCRFDIPLKTKFRIIGFSLTKISRTPLVKLISK